MIWATTISLLAFAATLPLSEAAVLDVWIPEIYYPHAGVEWHTGETHHVKWDTSNAPAQITNPTGEIYLLKGGIRILKLAGGFPLSAGQVSVTVPSVASGEYQINVEGDSGNDSESFGIN